MPRGKGKAGVGASGGQAWAGCAGYDLQRIASEQLMIPFRA